MSLIYTKLSKNIRPESSSTTVSTFPWIGFTVFFLHRLANSFDRFFVFYANERSHLLQYDKKHIEKKETLYFSLTIKAIPVELKKLKTELLQFSLFSYLRHWIISVFILPLKKQKRTKADAFLIHLKSGHRDMPELYPKL